MPRSNDIGRALEWEITRRLLSDIAGASAYGNTDAHQQRDRPKYERVGPPMQRYFSTASLLLLKWLQSEGLVERGVRIERLGDGAGTRGEVTDIRLRLPSGKPNTNLSIKHNNHDLKHPRPRPLAERAGYPPGSRENREYSELVESAQRDFKRSAEEIGASTFRDVKSKDQAVLDRLYHRICSAAVYLVNDMCDPDHRSTLVNFLQDSSDHLRVVVTARAISIWDLRGTSDIVRDSSARLEGNSYVVLDRGSSCLKLRIHSASSSIERVSLKYAVTLEPEPLPLWSATFATDGLFLS